MIYLHHDLDSNRIFVASDNFEKDDRFRFLPGSRWLPAKRIWSLPGTPGVAGRIVAACESDDFESTKSFDRILKQLDVDQSVKGQTDLPLYPIYNLKPWLHQLRAYHYIGPMPGVMLALTMSSGKTKIIYDHIQNRSIRRVLIAAPLRAIDDAWVGQFPLHWRADRDPHCTLVALDTGTMRERTRFAESEVATAEESARRIILLVNYDILFKNPFRDFALRHSWDLIVLDESHRIRAAGGRASKFLFRLGEKASQRIAMSGTPLANRPRDIFGQYRFLDAGVFGTNVGRFDELYTIRGGFNGVQILPGIRNEEDFNQKFYSIAFRVDENELDLPPEHDDYRKTDLEPEARRIYRELDKELTVKTARGSVTVKNTLVKSVRLRQLIAGRVKNDEGEYIEVSRAKKDLLADILGNLDVSEPLVIFGWFHQDLDAISDIARAAGRSVGELSGRYSDLGIWKRGDLNTLAVQIAAGSLSLDLTRSRYAIFYSVGFDLDLYQQARKRVRRTNQRKSVTFIHCLVRATEDMRIMAALRNKENVIESCLRQRANNEMPEE